MVVLVFNRNLSRIDSIVVFRKQSFRPEINSVFEMKRIHQETLKCQLDKVKQKKAVRIQDHPDISHEIRETALNDCTGIKGHPS